MNANLGQKVGEITQGIKRWKIRMYALKCNLIKLMPKQASTPKKACQQRTMKKDGIVIPSEISNLLVIDGDS